MGVGVSFIVRWWSASSGLSDKSPLAEQEGLLEDALAKQRRAEQDLATFKQHLAEERGAASAARERSRTAAAQGLAGREELAALRARMSSLQAELAKAKLDVKVMLR